MSLSLSLSLSQCTIQFTLLPLRKELRRGRRGGCGRRRGARRGRGGGGRRHLLTVRNFTFDMTSSLFVQAQSRFFQLETSSIGETVFAYYATPPTGLEERDIKGA